ncbi:hypothetical protein D3C87_241990 [compost metagenome]
MEMTTAGLIATLSFICALIQSLNSRRILDLSDKLKERNPVASRFLHFAGEPEIAMGMWAAVFLFALMGLWGFEAGLKWMDERIFSEVIFIFVIMILASSKPITEFAESIISKISNVIPLPKEMRMYFSIMLLGPLLGSLITEPAAMTISALLLKDAVFKPLKTKINDRFFYTTLAALFVNVSVGGTLTHFAAPPVLMVARVWDWDTPYMFMNFGWKALIAVLINTCIATWLNKEALKEIREPQQQIVAKTPLWITGVHLVFVVFCILAVHHPAFVVGLFLFFLGFYNITREAQSEVKIEESLLVGFFLGGLLILTAKQGWWLKPILSSVENLPLYLGTLALAPVTDNAAITSLASQVNNLSELSKYLIVAAAVVGGGMTIIANAPNPAGFTLLREYCPGRNLKPLKLFLNAFIPTLIAGTIFWFL